MKFSPGDVVVGPFATADRVLHHQSVVIGELEVNGKCYALLVYTTSKQNGSSYGGQFLPEDLFLAGWSNPCEWNSQRVSFTNTNRLKKRGTISKATLNKMMEKFELASARNQLFPNFVEE